MLLTSRTAAPAVRILEDGRTGSSFEYSVSPNGSYRIIASNSPGGVSVCAVRAVPDNCQSALNIDPLLECAPASGQCQTAILTGGHVCRS